MKDDVLFQKIENICQNYLGMNPSDKQCKNWNEMQKKMTGEIIAVMDKVTEDLHGESQSVEVKHKHTINFSCDGQCGNKYCDEHGCIEEKQKS